VATTLGYAGELRRAMGDLAEHPDTIFIGQAVECEGTAMTATLVDVPAHKKLELPVCEDMQAGIANGLALAGKIPVSIFPRWNFFLLATNQVVNHLDKIPEFSSYRPKVIIRTSVGAIWPWNSQAQHIGDYTDVYRAMLKNVEVIRLDDAEAVVPAYRRALERDDGMSTILVEWGDFYNEKGPFRPGADMTAVGRRHATS
jgi:pyruvate/2-oxoglutarate/acetoin dehydrogenase E1 component